MKLKRSPIWIKSAFFILVASSPGSTKSYLVNGFAASVGKSMITIQAGYVYRAIQRLKERDPKVGELETGEALRKTIQKMAFEEMVYLEMKSLGVESVPRSDAERQLPDLRKLPNWKKVLSRFGQHEADIVNVIWKTLQVERFIQKKVETLAPIVTDAEVERFHQSSEEYRNSELSTVKATIQLLLRKEKTEKGLEEWVRTLKEKYAVTSYLSA